MSALRIAVAFALLAGVGSAVAQTATTPGGGILHDLERRLPSQPLTAPDGARIEIPVAPALGIVDSTQRVTVRGYDIRGNTIFGIAPLSDLLANDVGELTLAQLSAVAEKVTAYYRSHGYLLARAYLPEQEVKDGQITIAVLEGRYGNIEASSEARISERRAKRTLESAVCNGADAGCSGALISRRPLERGLLLLNDLPGAQAAARLSPGDLTGTSTLDVDVQGDRTVAGIVQLDNGGSYYSGVARGIGTLWWNSPTGIGDRITLQGAAAGVHGELYYGSLGYGVPLGYSGLRLGLRGSYLRYELGNAYEPLDVHGTVKGGDATLHHPFIRSLAGNLYGSVGYGERRFNDEAGAVGTESERRIRDRMETGLNGELRDELFGVPALNTLTAMYTWGDVVLDPFSKFVDTLTARSAGRYEKWMAGYARLQPLFGNSSLFVRAAVQGTSDNLDSYEKFALGGPDSVRAYPPSETLVDNAVLYSAEWRQRIPVNWAGTLEGVVFYDRARGDLNADPWTTGINRITVDGVGVGLNCAFGERMVLRTTLAWRGDRPMTVAPDHSYNYSLSLTTML